MLLTLNWEHRMSLAADQLINEDREVGSVSTTLAAWYDAHASVRCLWAIETGRFLTVCISLEPTSDGDECLPIWLAKTDEWSSDLQSIIPREIQLRFVTSDVLPPSYVTGDAVIVAEIGWRNSWI
jgi:hypothetical protein